MSRVAGTGIPCEVFDAIVLDLLSVSAPVLDQLIDPVCAAVRARGLRLMQEGEPVTGATQERKVAGDVIERFLADRLPVLTRLGVIETAKGQPAKRSQEREGVRVEA